MITPSILQRVQDGLLDLDSAFAQLARLADPGDPTLLLPGPDGVDAWRAAGAGAGSQVESIPRRSAETRALHGVRRSHDGKVQLLAVDEAFELVCPALARATVQLVDVDAEQSDLSQDAVVHVAPGAGRGTGYDSVVWLTWPSPGVAQITLRDIEHHNMFTVALSDGLRRTFEQLSHRDDLKVVVVHGHGNWFCSGGTPELLDSIRAGDASFLDDPMFRALLDCPVPTVAAMDGHALGGGLTFGLYADLVVMSTNSYYAANFLEHGFTPGVGATHMFPHKMGAVLGHEMLLTARRYQGHELRQRGAQVQFAQRDRVLAHGLDQAQRFAQMPRTHLLELKACLTRPVRAALPDVLTEDQAMHDAVFAELRASLHGGRAPLQDSAK